METEQLYNKFLQSTGVTTDSRSGISGKIFFALQGDHFDGNDFANDALQRGCCCAVVSRKELCTSEKYIYSENPLTTLQNLAFLHRNSFSAKVIGLTGSNGKTTTKELISAVMARKYNVIATKGNLNNHIGVPLTLLSVREEDFAIIEMGANHPGEIKMLSAIADPEYGLITNIGKAHLEGFGGPEGVKRTKSELYHHVQSRNGVLFINGGNPVLMELTTGIQVGKQFYIDGENPVCDGYVHKNSMFLRLHLNFLRGKSWEVQTRLSGEYNFENVMAASAIGKYFGVEEEDIVSALEEYQPQNNRSQYVQTERNRLIMDAYNANPSSMAESLNHFIKYSDRQKMVILGDMLELGQYEEQEHHEILEFIRMQKDLCVLLVGPVFSRLAGKFGFVSFQTTEEAIEHLSKNPVNDFLVLLKGSRGIRLEKIKDVL